MFDELDQAGRDRLCAVHSRGLRQAAEALSRLLRRPVLLDPEPARLLTSGREGIGVRMTVCGELSGELLLFLADPAAAWLSGELLGGGAGRELLRDPAASTLGEFGNILASAYLASLDDQLQLASFPSPPELTGASLATLLADVQPLAEQASPRLRARLSWGASEAEWPAGELFLLPDGATRNKLLALFRPR